MIESSTISHISYESATALLLLLPMLLSYLLRLSLSLQFLSCDYLIFGESTQSFLEVLAASMEGLLIIVLTRRIHESVIQARNIIKFDKLVLAVFQLSSTDHLLIRQMLHMVLLSAVNDRPGLDALWPDLTNRRQSVKEHRKLHTLHIFQHLQAHSSPDG